jgi:putative DNA primase/helicase
MDDDQLAQISAFARFQSREKAGAEKSTRGKDEKLKPEIELGPKDSPRLGEAVTRAMMELVARDAKVYQRAGKLMRPITEPSFDAQSNSVMVDSLIELDEAALKLLLMRELRWVRRLKNEGKRFVNPGFEIPRLILKARGWPFAPVSGLINAPTLRPDGSLLWEEGYDDKTGLLLINPPKVPIKLKPTCDDAAAALKILQGLLSEVPFVKDMDRAVALSLILTTILRGALETSPLHIFVAPTAGSGKSFVVDIASLIATGHRCAVVAATGISDELEKRLGAAMVSGRTLISLDNLSGELSSNLLCQAVSQPVISFRPLGVSSEVNLTTRSVFVATGNNLSIADDLGRRTLLATLDPGLERPWQRQFQQKPLEMITRDRPRYIGAALEKITSISCTLKDGATKWALLLQVMVKFYRLQYHLHRLRACIEKIEVLRLMLDERRRF